MEQKRLPIFAERFAELRGSMTQGAFADFLGISRPTVGFYENGSRLPDALVLRQIAEICHVSSDWLIGLTSDRERRPSAIDVLGLSAKAVEALKGMNAMPSGQEMNATPFIQRCSGILPNAGLLLINGILENEKHIVMTYFTTQALLAGLKVEIMDSSEEDYSNLEGLGQSVVDGDNRYIKVPTKDAARLYMRSACDVFEDLFEDEINSALEVMLQHTDEIIKDAHGTKKER